MVVKVLKSDVSEDLHTVIKKLAADEHTTLSKFIEATLISALGIDKFGNKLE